MGAVGTVLTFFMTNLWRIQISSFGNALYLNYISVSALQPLQG